MRLRATMAITTALTLLVACNKGGSSPETKEASETVVSPREAEAIAKEAYVYAYPMMENYRTMFVQAVDRTAPGYVAPFNQLAHMTELLGPDFKDIVRPNNDTMYSTGCARRSSQPIEYIVSLLGRTMSLNSGPKSSALCASRLNGAK